MRKTIIKLLRELEEREIPMKYYAFDWDDNLMYMPTKIYLLDDDGEEVGMGTEDFAEHRTEIGKTPFDYNGFTIVDFAPNPFRDFKTDGDKKFLQDVMSAKLATDAAWPDFVEAINNGSLFSIITARGHNPMTLMRGVKKLIDSNRGGIDSDELYESLVEMRENAGEIPQDKETEILKYLKMCRFYPVSYGEGSATNPEIAKIDAMNRFKNYVQSQADKLNIRLSKKIENEISNKFVPMIGFSDDDPRNIAAMSKGVKDVKIFSTYGGKKKLYKPDEPELQLEYKIKYILKNIIKY
jgi:hypothetical protein